MKQIEQLTPQVRQAVEDLQTAIVGVRVGELAPALRFYKAAKDAYDIFELQRKKIGELLEGLSRNTIPEMMVEAEVRTITLDDIGYRFTVSHRWSCTIQDKDAGIPWLKANGYEALVFETVNAQTLAGWAKKMVEEEGKEPEPSIFKTGTMAYTSVTKA